MRAARRHNWEGKKKISTTDTSSPSRSDDLLLDATLSSVLGPRPVSCVRCPASGRILNFAGQFTGRQSFDINYFLNSVLAVWPRQYIRSGYISQLGLHGNGIPAYLSTIPTYLDTLFLRRDSTELEQILVSLLG